MSESTLATARARHPALADATFGAVVTLVLSFVPFSSVAGGAVAAFRYGGGSRWSLGMGALSETIAAVPLVVFFLVYTVGLGALGGLAGAWTRRNTDRDLSLEGWFFGNT